MLEHQKLVLQNLSEHKDLFRKELYKSLAWLSDNEQEELFSWLKLNYGHTHNIVLQEVFYKETAA